MEGDVVQGSMGGGRVSNPGHEGEAAIGQDLDGLQVDGYGQVRPAPGPGSGHAGPDDGQTFHREEQFSVCRDTVGKGDSTEVIVNE